MTIKRFTLKTAVITTVLGLVAGISSFAIAATLTSGTNATLSMVAGDTVGVTCTGPSLAYNNATLACAPNPTTTTTAPATTTTTVAATTTTTSTIPATTTTVVVGPTTTTTAPATPGAFPDATNTGVPAGTTLTAWTGSTTISTCQTITGKTFPNGLTVTAKNGTSSAATPCVTIQDSKVTGVLFTGYSGAGPTVIKDSEVIGQSSSTTPPLWQDNFFGFRLNVHGGRGQVDCDGVCSLTDSWVHDEAYSGATHMQAFETNGQTSGGIVTLEHDSFDCDPSGTATGGGGCAADVSFFGDNASVNGSVVKDNLFIASSGQFGYCVYTGGSESSKPFGTGTNLDWENNTFQKGKSGKCGDAGPVADWAHNSGNVWSGNHYDDGTPINL